MSKLNPTNPVTKRIIVSCIIAVFCIISFAFLLSFLVGILFGGENLSAEDETRLRVQMDKVLHEYKNEISEFEIQNESMKIAAPYSQHISNEKEIQYVEGKYQIDVSSDISISVIEGLWVDDGEVKHVNTFNCGTVDYVMKNCSLADVENWTFEEEDILNAILQEFYCDYYNAKHSFKDELLSLKGELIDNYNKEKADNITEKLYIQVKKESTTPFSFTVKMSIEATDETNSSFNLYIHFYRNY